MPIILRLQGGLGNQMFQYALGRKLSRLKNAPLLLDKSGFEHDSLRAYALDPFVMEQKFATANDKERFLRFKRKQGGAISARAYNFLKARWNRYAQEKQLHFDPDVFDVSADAYIDGYWTTEKYFKDIRDVLLEDFRLREPLSGKNKQAADAMAACNSVSVHIRRGDYATDPQTNAVFGTLDAEYYSRAFDAIGKQVTNPELFVLSDDMDWVKNNIRAPFKTTYIEWNVGAPHEDLRLMSLCKHHIIANSTFSWWGAWLGANPDKVVIGPARWFKSQKKSVDTKDILPESWIKL